MRKEMGLTTREDDLFPVVLGDRRVPEPGRILAVSSGGERVGGEKSGPGQNRMPKSAVWAFAPTPRQP